MYRLFLWLIVLFVHLVGVGECVRVRGWRVFKKCNYSF